MKVAAADGRGGGGGGEGRAGRDPREAAILSSWDAESEFSRWFRTRDRAVPVSGNCWKCSDCSTTGGARTGGALDAAAEAVTRAWKIGGGAGPGLRRQREKAAVVAAVRQPHWRLDAAAGTAIHLSDTPLAMNSFVKSYIWSGRRRRRWRPAGVSGVVVNIGGDLVVRGAWTETVGVADPRSDAENSAPVERVTVSDRAVATSGSYRRGVEIAGRHYSHIVDPRTGEAAGEVLSATVIAPKAVDAGALATAFCVLTPRESARLAATVPGVEY